MLADALNPNAANLVQAALRAFNGSTFDLLRIAATQWDVPGTQTLNVPSNTALVSPRDLTKKMRIMTLAISVSVQMSVLFYDVSQATIVFRTPVMAANTGYNWIVNGGNGYLLSAAGAGLFAVGTGNGTMTGTIAGTEE